MMEGICHVGIVVSDLERSVAFYRDTLGFDFLLQVDMFEGYVEKGTGVPGARIKLAMLQLGDAEIELIQYVHPERRPYDRRNCDVRVAHLAFLVTDIDRTYEQLYQREVHFLAPPQRVAEGERKGWKWTYLSDPDGFQIEICHPPQQAKNYPS